MTTRLGLDIGTNSIGWCLFNLDGQGKPVGIRDIGVRIFSDGRDPKSGASLAVDRRDARAMRRRRDRYIRRRSALLEALIDTGLMPADIQDAKALVGCDPYALRAAALDEALNPHRLGRALFHLNQRRGFKSNRKAERKAGDDKEGGKIAGGAKALDLAMQEAGARTYGEFLAGRDAKRVRMRTDGDGYDFYPERRHLEAEFYAIWAAQSAHHPALLNEAVRDRLWRIIFYQRPLKAPKVGNCTFFNEEERLPKAHPLFQERRLYEEVNQLEITKAGAPSRKLSLDQRDKIILKLKSAKTASFSGLSKLLKLADGESFNKASENRTGLVGDEIFASFSDKKCFGDRWAHFDPGVQWSICNREKGNQTPWDKWGDSDRWPIIAEQASRLDPSKRWRFAPDVMDRFKGEQGFIARQLTDTQYLSRMARTYLSSLYPERPSDRLPGEGVKGVYVIPGRMTAMLRRLWGLNELLPDHNYVENPHSGAPKNRLDHRHHAIDAAVVGVTTRSLLNEISKAAGRAETQNLDKLFVDLPKPWETFRDDLREALDRVVVSHKADHGRRGVPAKDKDVTAARLHNDTAYGLTGLTSDSGLPIVVHRVPLLSLKPAHITDPIRIPDAALQRALWAVTEGKTGKDFEAALVRFSKLDPVFKGIRHVRVREALKVIPIRDASGHAFKAYKGDANARYDVWRMPDGKWVSSWKDRDGKSHSGVISMFEAHQTGQPEQRPHPAAKRVLSLRQNDLVAVELQGQLRKIMRVVKFSSGGQITFAEHHEAGPLKARDANSSEIDPFKYFYSSAGGLQKAKARQIRIDELGRLFDPGPR